MAAEYKVAGTFETGSLHTVTVDFGDTTGRAITAADVQLALQTVNQFGTFASIGDVYVDGNDKIAVVLENAQGGDDASFTQALVDATLTAATAVVS
jgi:hypothetical protein